MILCDLQIKIPLQYQHRVLIELNQGQIQTLQRFFQDYCGHQNRYQQQEYCREQNHQHHVLEIDGICDHCWSLLVHNNQEHAGCCRRCGGWECCDGESVVGCLLLCVQDWSWVTNYADLVVISGGEEFWLDDFWWWKGEIQRVFQWGVLDICGVFCWKIGNYLWLIVWDRWRIYGEEEIVIVEGHLKLRHRDQFSNIPH